MRKNPAVRALFAAVAVTLATLFAGGAFAGTDRPAQGKDAVDCKAKPDDPRCRASK